MSALPCCSDVDQLGYGEHVIDLDCRSCYPGGRGAFLCLRPNEGTDLTGMAVHTPKQRPEGPLPAHVPLPRDGPSLPVPLAMRGPATAFIRICPEAETWPPT